MEYTLHLHVTKEKSTFSLKEGENTKDTLSWAEGRDMGRKLFEAIRDLLEKNNLSPLDIGDFMVKSDIPEIYTSARIAETVRQVYNFGVSTKINKKR